MDIPELFADNNIRFQIKFVDFNFTLSNVLNLNWILHLNKTIQFHSLLIFEGSSVRMRMDKSTVSFADVCLKKL